MQDKSIEKNSLDPADLSARLRRLRVTKQWTWAQLAKELMVSEPMIYQVLRGDRQFGARVEFRLMRIEEESGLKTNYVTGDTSVAPDGSIVLTVTKPESSEISNEIKSVHESPLESALLQLAEIREQITAIEDLLRTGQLEWKGKRSRRRK